ncbi:MAG: tetratricopeptide repeat protein, partial [Nitrosopumilaceae archaeon]|nr:tetratricopeptide repeat protein [Nitrosopumilaceae archaeon]
FFNKGSTFNELKKYEEATECYDKAIELNPDYPEAFYGKGSTFKELKKYKEAIECYDKAIEIISRKPFEFFRWASIR